MRPLAQVLFGWRPTTLLVTVLRYRCSGCGYVWRQDLSRAEQPRAELTRGGLRWALQAIVCQHLTVARLADGLAVAWNTANDAVLAEGERVLIADPHRLDGIRVLGVDRRVQRDTRHRDKYVTVIIDLTGIRDGTGPARLFDMVDMVDMVEGRSEQASEASPNTPGLARPGRGRRDGWVHRLGDRHHRVTARGRRGDRPVPSRAVGRRLPGPVPTARPAADVRSPWPHQRPATPPAGRCTPPPACSPTGRRPGCRRCS